MTTEQIITLLRDGVFQILLLAGPILLVALMVGLVVAIFQATTSIQEQTLTFVPKLIAILGMLALLGGWMFTSLEQYTVNLFSLIGQMTR